MMVILLREADYSSWLFRTFITFLSILMVFHLIFGSRLQTTGQAIRTKGYHSLSKCQTHLQHCEHVCGCEDIVPNLTPPLCDRTGTCVCDCTNKTLVDSKPVPLPCSKWIDSVDHDTCAKYCSNIYQRPYKICGETSPVPKLFCTCVCKWY